MLLPIRIGPTSLSLLFGDDGCDDHLLHKAAFERYRGFVVPGCEGLPVKVFSGRVPSSFRLDAGRTVQHVNGADVYHDGDSVAFAGVSSEYLLDSCIRVLLSNVLCTQGAALLHASSVADQAGGYVFMGVSGVGKSTVARLSRPRLVLTDEISLLECSGNRVFCYGTPFWGDYRLTPVRAVLPVRAICQLVQGPENQMKRLPGSVAMASLLRNVLFFDRSDGASVSLQSVLEIAKRIIAMVPVYELTFKQEPSFWDVLNELEVV